MEEEKMLVPSGLKTVDGKDIMCYTGAFYLKNEEKIKRIIKKCEEILDAESEDIKKIQRNITIKEDSEKYNLDIHINKKHDKLFKELLSDKKEAVKFINHYLHLNLLDDEIEKYEKEFRTEEFRNIEADVVYKVKNKNVFILIEHQSSLDLKMAYRILRYKNAIIESAINKRKLKEKNYKIPKVIPIVLYTGKRKWQKLSIEDIEEKIEGYEEIELGYDLVDTNEFTKQQLLEDNLITSKAMLIEKSQNKEELYQNIEDIISCKNKMEDFEYAQLEKIVKYELMQEPVLDKDKDDIDWRELEDTAESLYNSWATITIDLNSQNVSKNDILMFNTNLDNLMNSLKNKDKKNSKICLANLYSTLPKYMEQTSQDSNAISFRRVKANVLFSYAMLDTGDWDSINKFLSQAEVDLKNLMETGNVNGNFKKSTVDKSYVLLRELIKTGNEKNIDLFYVKYMNLIAELEKA